MYWLSVCWKLPQQQSAKGTDFLLWLSAQCESEVMFHQSLLCKKVKHLAEIPFFRQIRMPASVYQYAETGIFLCRILTHRAKLRTGFHHRCMHEKLLWQPKKFIKTNFFISP